MLYNYQENKQYVITEQGFKNLIKVINFINENKQTTVFMMQDLMCLVPESNTWKQMAHVHFLVEAGVLEKIESELTAGQHELFIRKGNI